MIAWTPHSNEFLIPLCWSKRLFFRSREIPKYTRREKLGTKRRKGDENNQILSESLSAWNVCSKCEKSIGFPGFPYSFIAEISHRANTFGVVCMFKLVFLKLIAVHGFAMKRVKFLLFFFYQHFFHFYGCRHLCKYLKHKIPWNSITWKHADDFKRKRKQKCINICVRHNIQTEQLIQ